MADIKFSLTDSAVDEIQRCESREARGKLLLGMINERINDVQDWARRNLGEDFTKFEVAAIRTFLYRELTGELDGTGDISNLPRVPLSEHPAASM